MGIFDADVNSESLLTNFQEWIESLSGQGLATILQGYGAGNVNYNRLEKQLRRSGRRSRRDLRSVLRDSRRSGQEFEREAFRSFDDNVAPRINQAFARHGASLGSRRGQTTADALVDTQANVDVQKVGLRTSDLDRRLAGSSQALQQNLGMIQGLGQIQQQQFAPLLLANQFLSRQSQQLTSSPGIGQQLLQLGGIGLGAGLFGQPGQQGPDASGIFGLFGGGGGGGGGGGFLPWG